MSEYEYKAECVTFNYLEQYLNRIAKNGWKCIHINTTEDFKKVLIVMGREVKKENKWGIGDMSYGWNKGLLSV